VTWCPEHYAESENRNTTSKFCETDITLVWTCVIHGQHQDSFESTGKGRFTKERRERRYRVRRGVLIGEYRRMEEAWS
jgi:hypothetical protein